MVKVKLKSALIVDDDETSTFLNKVLLKNLNSDITVNTAANGQEAIRVLQNAFKDKEFGGCLLLLDVQMPTLDGWEFLQIYEETFSQMQRKQIVLLLLSNHIGSEIDQKVAQFKSVKACLTKPLTNKGLKHIVKEYFSSF